MWYTMTQCLALGLLFTTLAFGQAAAGGDEKGVPCKPTEEDEMGPFYRPGAPLRSVLGSGYILSGTVRAAGDCRPLDNALVEFWMTGPDGHYSDAYRAAVITGVAGRYRLETDLPGIYGSRPIHIHIRAEAYGHAAVTTQHYPAKGQSTATFDLVLPPAKP